MQINFYELKPTQNNINFTSNSKEFRQKYSTKLENNNISGTSMSNLKRTSEIFSEEGLTYQKLLKASEKNPFLLFHKPETIEKNVKGTVQRLEKYGLTTEKYLNCLLNYPNLFSISPEKIEQNIKNTVKNFKSTGLTEEKYLEAAIKNARIFVLRPQSLKKKVNKIIENINLSRKDLIEMFLKQPTQFTVNEKEIIKKYKLLKYIEENKYFDKGLPIPKEDELKGSILRKSFTYSLEHDYLILLRNKLSNTLSYGKKINLINVKGNITNYILENKQKLHEITIPNSEIAKDFIRFSKKFSKSIVGKNIFKFTVI